MPDLHEDLDGIPDGRELTGQRLGPCAIESLIGCGGMGSVWLATHVKLHKKVAVKVLSEALSRDSSYVKRFVREAEALAQLDHPNIAGVLDFGEDQGFRYIVMQYVQGESVRERISRRGRMAPAEATAVLRDVLKALAYAHSRGFIHRDIKPSNILLDEQGNARLTDFGLVKSISSVNLTMTGTAIGTPQYMSPEQWDGAAADPRMDIWAAGVTFYHLLTGNVPFEGTGAAQVAKSIALHTPRTLAEHGVAAPRGLQLILDKMLAKEAARRYISATAVLQELNELSGVMTPGTLPVQHTGELAQPTRTLASSPVPPVASATPATVAPPSAAAPSSAAVTWKVQLAMLKVFVVILILLGSAGLGWMAYSFFGGQRGEGKRGGPTDDGGKAEAERERLRQKTEDEKRRQEQERENRAAEARRKLEGLLADAARLRGAGRLDEAMAKYTEAQGLAPSDETVKTAIEQVQKEILAGKSVGEQRAAYEQHCREAADFERQGDWEKAAAAYRKALIYKKDDKVATDKLNLARHNVFKALGEAALEGKDYDEAEVQYGKALGCVSVPASEQRLKEIRALKQRKIDYGKALERALDLEKKAGTVEEWAAVAKAYRAAQDLAEDKVDSQKGEARAEEQKKKIQLRAAYEAAVREGDQYLADGKWENARTAYRRAREVEGYIGDAVVARKLEEVGRLEEKSRREATQYAAWPFDAAEARRRQKDTAGKLGVAAERSVDLGNDVKLDLVLIPAGEFDMGSPESEAGRAASEGPVHRVKLTRPFWMGKYEVTQDVWEKVMGANPCAFRGPRNPAETVSWDDCQNFLQKLNGLGKGTFRLPTEAEWEYACRAGTKTAFNVGETISIEQANVKGKSGDAAGKGRPLEKTAAAGAYPANAWGLHDMHGNVLEWCSDWFDAGYYQKSPAENPAGPEAGTSRVARGGSWTRTPAGVRSASRDLGVPGGRSIGIGLRVAAAAGAP